MEVLFAFAGGVSFDREDVSQVRVYCGSVQLSVSTPFADDAELDLVERRTLDASDSGVEVGASEGSVYVSTGDRPAAVSVTFVGDQATDGHASARRAGQLVEAVDDPNRTHQKEEA